jgi:hypothetical protein
MTLRRRFQVPHAACVPSATCYRQAAAVSRHCIAVIALHSLLSGRCRYELTTILNGAHTPDRYTRAL